MPNFLSDPPAYAIVLYVVAAMIAVSIWYRYRTRNSQIAMFAVLAAVALLFFLSYRYDSPREEAIRRVNGVIDAMNRFDTGTALEHVSEQFEYHKMRKSGLRTAGINSILQSHQAHITPWDFARDDVQYDPSGNAVTIGFNVNVRGDMGQIAFYVRAKCSKDPDGVYRIVGFKVHENVLQKANGPEFNVPGMGPGN